MKAILGWLCDPYIHMFVVALIIVRLAMGFGGDESTDAAASPTVRCQTCLRPHDNGNACVPAVARTSGALQAD